LTDLDLAQHCARGDRQAQRALYERHSDRVYRLLCRMCGNTEDALDLAQDTFVRVFEKINTFDGASSLMTWIYRIAVNESLQFRRRENRRGSILLRLARDRRDERTTSPEHAGNEVLDALVRLPEAERVLLTLRYAESLSYEEMAKVLGKPAGTIASGLNRARQMLRQILNADSVKNSPGSSIQGNRGSTFPSLRESIAAPARRGVAEGRGEP
jgi:RNA polymerase sigma-70 factor, ECF subfamily